MSYRIVGIDTSLTGTGVARIVDGKVDTKIIGSKGGAQDGLAMRTERLRSLVKRILEFALEGHDPNADGPLPLFLIEQPAYSKTQGHMHDRSGLWWLTVHMLSKQGLVVEVVPGSLKRYITGKGNASKDQVLTDVVRAYPDVYVSDNNVADALVLAAMGARQLGRPIEPARARITATALEGVRWPQIVER